MGRSSKYTDKIADEICERLANGDSLNEICNPPAPATFPVSEAAVRAWALDDKPPGFAARYARARDMGMDALAERALQIAADGSRDYTIDKYGKPMLIAEHVQRSRLICDQIKWHVAKMAPKRYGERLDLTTGGDKLPANNTVIALADALTQDQLAALEAKLAGQGGASANS
jgi:hypothetical protein